MSDEKPPNEDVERGGEEGDPWNADIVDRLRTFAKTINSKFVTNGRYFFTEADYVSDQDLQYFAMVDAIEVIEHYRQKLTEAKQKNDQLLEAGDNLSSWLDMRNPARKSWWELKKGAQR